MKFLLQGGEDGILFEGAEQGANSQLRNFFQPKIFEGLRVTEASRIQEHLHASITQDLSKTSFPRSRLQLVIFSLFSYFSTKTPDMILSLSLSMEKVRVKMLETPSPAQPNVIL